MGDLGYRRMQDDAEREALAVVLGLCFGGGTEDAKKWMARHPDEDVRLLTDGARVAGGLYLIPMGQWFGGRSVPMTGIAAVGIDPGDRAAGAGTVLMQETVRELHREGVALSALFPAVQPLYRRAGYEQAGGHYSVSLDTSRVFAADRGLDLRRLEDSDTPAVEEAQRANGRENDGNLDRNDVMWDCVRRSTRGEIHGFGVSGASGLEGYVYYLSQKNARGHQDLFCTDLVARTGAAARRLVTFFRDHKSLVDSVRWRGHPADPLITQTDELAHDLRVRDVWMLRLCDVAVALRERGYPAGLDAELHLDVTDDVCPENGGRYVLHVADGTASVERGGAGRVPLHVRTLASLYAGFLTADQARVSFGLQCRDDDAATLRAVFAGPTPWMQDGF